MSGCSSTSVPARLREREEARQCALEKRRAEKREQRRPEESSKQFVTQLEAKKEGKPTTFYVATLAAYIGSSN